MRSQPLGTSEQLPRVQGSRGNDDKESKRARPNRLCCRFTGIDDSVCRRATTDRPDGFGHRTDVGDRHSAEEHRRHPAAQDRRRRVEYISLEDGGDTTRAVQNVKKLIAGEQHRRADRPVDDAQRIRDPGRDCRCQGADDGDRRHVRDRRAAGREKALGLQDDAERRPDRRGAAWPHGEERRQIGRLHRLQRSVRRELAQGVQRAGRESGRQGRRGRTLTAAPIRASRARR